MPCIRLVALLVIVVGGQLLNLQQSGLAQKRASAPGRQTLTVVLYPFIPEFTTAAYTVKRLFEAENPDIELVILDLSDNYYDPSKPAFIGGVATDVYELDSVFLADFVDEKKIQRLPASSLLTRDQLLHNAYDGSMYNGERYGSAHWVCGNFLFFAKPNWNVATLKDVESAVGGAPKQQLLVDLRGKLTLGEFYLGAAYAKYKTTAEVAKHLDSPDESLEADLVRLLKLCPVGGCRDQISHEDTGIYGQQFASGQATALIGYSELLHSVLKEGMEDSAFVVKPLPLDDLGLKQVSWVDSFVVATSCTGSCFDRATKFLQFMQRDDVYMSLLLPDRPSFLQNPAGPKPVPAYLLPAKVSLYSNPTLKASASHYDEFRSIIGDSLPPTSSHLNNQLRTISSSVEIALKRASTPQP